MIPARAGSAGHDQPLMKKKSHQVIVVLNGPGEVSAWLYPFAAALRRHAPQVRLGTALVPCVFASGRELDVVQTMDGVDAVSRPAQTLGYICGGDLPEGFQADLPGCVLHFGGEPIFSWLLAKRLGYPMLAYSEGAVGFESRYQKVFLVDDSKMNGRPRDGKYQVVGNIMIDAARLRCSARKKSRRSPLTIGLFPGSREYMIKHLLPFLIKMVEQVSVALPGARWMIGKANFINLESIKRAASDDTGRLLDGTSARWEEGGPSGTLVSPSGVRMEIHPPSAVMEQADLIVTIPGTNTAELAALGIPMMVLVPTQHSEAHPLPGVLGYIDHLPWLGPYIKRHVALAFLRRHRYLAHPNRRAGREVVPEIVGDLTPAMAAAALVRILEQPGGAVERDLVSVMGPPGATDRLVDEVLTFLNKKVSAS